MDRQTQITGQLKGTIDKLEEMEQRMRLGKQANRIDLDR
jgi:hypothetical protein